MQGTFHWIRVQAFCYATENEELLHDTFQTLIGTEEFECDISDGEHGNRTIIFSKEFEKQKEVLPLFVNLGEDMIRIIIDDIDNRIDDDCVFYLRLDKQKAVTGDYRMAHHGDVIAITGKVVSHPARKEIATKNLVTFLSSLLPQN